MLHPIDNSQDDDDFRETVDDMLLFNIPLKGNSFPLIKGVPFMA